MRSPSARLIVSVTGAAAIAASASGRASSAAITASASSRAEQRPRGVVDEHGVAAGRSRRARGAPTPSAPARRPRRRPAGARLRGQAGAPAPGGSATTICSIAGQRAERVDAPLQQRPAGELDERLRAAPRPRRSPLPAATIRATVICDGAARARGSVPRSAMPRAREPRYFAPATASWLLAESASSSSR